jgi:hypothetical protein
MDYSFGIKDIVLPEEYFLVLNQANGFYTLSGLFRFFGTVPFEGIPDIISLNHSDWISEYDNPKISEIFFFAEDIFGNFYGFLMQKNEQAKIVKFYCEGDEIMEFNDTSLISWLNQKILIDDLEIIDTEMAYNFLSQKSVQLSEHIAFSLPLMLGGAYDLSNCEVMERNFHLALLGQVVSQVRKYPDGSKIKRFDNF